MILVMAVAALLDKPDYWPVRGHESNSAGLLANCQRTSHSDETSGEVVFFKLPCLSSHQSGSPTVEGLAALSTVFFLFIRGFTQSCFKHQHDQYPPVIYRVTSSSVPSLPWFAMHSVRQVEMNVVVCNAALAAGDHGLVVVSRVRLLRSHVELSENLRKITPVRLILACWFSWLQPNLQMHNEPHNQQNDHWSCYGHDFTYRSHSGKRCVTTRFHHVSGPLSWFETFTIKPYQTISNHIKPYQSIKRLQTRSNAFKVHGPWRSRFRNPFVTGVLDLKHFDHWKVEPDLISLNTASATWLDDRLQVQSNR